MKNKAGTWGLVVGIALAIPALYLGLRGARPAPEPAAAQDGVPAAFRKHPRVVAVMEFTSSAHTVQYIDGAKSEAASLGLNLEIRDARHDRKAMADMLDEAVLQKVDGIMLSHGDPESLRKGAERAVAQGIPLVAFDDELPLPEVTKIDQNDHKIAEMALDRLISDTQGKANLVLIWVPGFAPMEKRMETYTRIMAQNPGLHEVARFGKATNNTALQTEVEMAEVLKTHPKGTIDAVWATWDEFARGATNAIRKAGRTEIKLYGVDVSNEDLEMIQAPDSPWLATVGCSGVAVGRVQVRMLGYRIAGRPLPASYSLEPVLIAREMLPKGKQIGLEALPQFLPAFADTKDFTDPWIVSIKEKIRNKE